VQRSPAAAPNDARSFIGSLFVHRRRFIEALVDALLISASFTIAFLIVNEGTGVPWQRHVFDLALPAVLLARYVFFMLFGLYRGVWRYAGARDAASIIAAIVLSETAAFLFIWATVQWNGFPRTTFLVDALLCSLLIGTARFWERGVAHALRSLVARDAEERTVIVGAGRSGRSLLRELRETPGVRVVGFLDDDPALLRQRIQRVPVLAGLADIGWVLGRFEPDTVHVTVPDADRARLDGIIEACRRAGVSCRFVRRHIDLDPASALGAVVE
jgi:FlaA1/EpsC-like NDP-sugar epimerase